MPAELPGDPATPVSATAPVPVMLRPHRPGDIGWIVSHHGALYSTDYGLDARFEATVARIGAHFLEHFEPAREACWIAERAGQPLGSVMLVQARDDATDAPRPGVAQLRLLLVDPAARGLGLGRRLVEACHAFARSAGYRRIILWTQSELLAARRLYATAGYALAGTEAHRSFGREQLGEVWERDL